MKSLINGIHHVTAILGAAQKSMDFYAGILGLRLIKKTVNFDGPDVYHLYFGDSNGTPGSIFTVFPYGDSLREGRHGYGKVNTTAFSLPLDSLPFWQKRLEKFQVAHKHPQQRFGGEVFIYLEDPDGLGLELTFDEKEQRPGSGFNPNIAADYSIRGIHHAELWLDQFEKTAALLTTLMNHRLLEESSGRFRYGVDDLPGKYVDILWAGQSSGTLKGRGGRGMVHHLAFAAPDKTAQMTLHSQLEQMDLHPTEVKNRKYFSSVYFTEPGGILFEIATTGPGFTIDESTGELGTRLQLPENFEWKRAALNEQLPTVNYEAEKFKSF